VTSIIDLRFYGPYLLCSEHEDLLAQCPYSKESGIYLKAVKQSSGIYRVFYLGETGTSFYQRMKEHIVQTLGGNYRICDPDALREGIQTVIWDGLWRKGTRDKLPEFLQHYEALAPIVKRSLTVQEVFVAPFESERRLRQRIEGSLALALRSDTTASSLMASDVRYYKRRKDEEPVMVNIEAKSEIEGFPLQIAA
jgi:hypothetical protein